MDSAVCPAAPQKVADGCFFVVEGFFDCLAFSRRRCWLFTLGYLKNKKPKDRRGYYTEAHFSDTRGSAGCVIVITAYIDKVYETLP